MLYYIVLYYVMLCDVMLCYVMWCVMLCHVMLCCRGYTSYTRRFLLRIFTTYTSAGQKWHQREPKKWHRERQVSSVPALLFCRWGRYWGVGWCWWWSNRRILGSHMLKIWKWVGTNWLIFWALIPICLLLKGIIYIYIHYIYILYYM